MWTLFHPQNVSDKRGEGKVQKEEERRVAATYMTSLCSARTAPPIINLKGRTEERRGGEKEKEQEANLFEHALLAFKLCRLWKPHGKGGERRKRGKKVQWSLKIRRRGEGEEKKRGKKGEKTDSFPSAGRRNKKKRPACPNHCLISLKLLHRRGWGGVLFLLITSQEQEGTV